MRWPLSLNIKNGITRRCYSFAATSSPYISINNATFHRSYPSLKDDFTNPSIFPGLTFELPSSSSPKQFWAVVGPSNGGKSTFLNILHSKYICTPPDARRYPYITSSDRGYKRRSPTKAVQYVGFSSEGDALSSSRLKGAYMSARYESRKEEDDISLENYLRGRTELNAPDEAQALTDGQPDFGKVLRSLHLDSLVDLPVSSLSNGQSRRARIARSLLSRPHVLLLDEPFMGLDPPAVEHLSALLNGMGSAEDPVLILALRPQDPLPTWITHEVEVGEGLRAVYVGGVRNQARGHPRLEPGRTGGAAQQLNCASSFMESKSKVRERGELTPIDGYDNAGNGNSIVSMKGVQIKYGNRMILGDWNQYDQDERRPGLWWNIKRGQRWGIVGPNGSGKTTLISLICSDHPQSYSQPIEVFGRSRLPERGSPGITIFDIQSRIGQSSPEIHKFFPRGLTIRQTLESAWADTFLGSPILTAERDDMVDTCLRWFEPEMNPNYTSQFPRTIETPLSDLQFTEWADDVLFGQVPFLGQRVALFLRAIIKRPELVVLDEAFSGMDFKARDKCIVFLTEGNHVFINESKKRAITRCDSRKVNRDNLQGRLYAKNYRDNAIPGLDDQQALICVSHVKEEVPPFVREWMRLAEPASGTAPRFYRISDNKHPHESPSQRKPPLQDWPDFTPMNARLWQMMWRGK